MEARAIQLGELAARLDAELRGDAERLVTGMADLGEAGPSDLAFLAEPRYRAAAEASAAGALVLNAEEAARPAFLGRDLLVVAEVPQARLAALAVLYPPVPVEPGIDPTARIAATARLGPGVHIGPFAVLGEDVEVGAGAVVHAHVVVGRGCRLGAGSVLYPRVVLYDEVELGERVLVHAGAVLGADGFGYVTRGGVHHKVPQVGRVVVEADVEIGANSTIDRAAMGETRIGAGTKIDNLVQVGHNVKVGRGCVVCGQVGIAGSARLADFVVLGGQAGVAGHLEVGRGVQVAAKSALLQDTPSGVMAGIPAVEIGLWRRQFAALARLPEALRRLRRLERGGERAPDSPTGDPSEE